MTLPASAASSDRSFFGHPRGLRTLFFTEMWERWSFYGMRALLVLFMSAALGKGGYAYSEDISRSIYHIYLSLVYLMSVPGGWVADRLLGARRSVLYGGIVIMLGHIALAIYGVPFFFVGLGLVVLGTGLLKPNISTIVGHLYTAEDQRRDAGFSIFYMGINLGAFLAPLATGWLASSDEGSGFRKLLESWGVDPNHAWQFGFGAAAVGMFCGIVQFILTRRHLGDAGIHSSVQDPEERRKAWRTLGLWSGGAIAVLGAFVFYVMSGADTSTAVVVDKVGAAFNVFLTVLSFGFFVWLFLSGRWTPGEQKRLIVITLLFVASTLFWSAFEQAGSTLNLFAENKTRRTLWGIDFPTGWFQSLQPLFLIVLSPVFAWIWFKMGKRDPPSPIKFSLGLLFAGLGFLILIPIDPGSGPSLIRVSPFWLILTYLAHTIGELCLSPVGLSAMSRLAPVRVQSMMMGVWFLSIGTGSYLGGRIAHYYEGFSATQLYYAIAAITIGPALLLAMFTRPIQRLLKESE